ncbi:MAG: DUF4054 domain-containing protein [Methyloglobulus sp.]|nr:DUF4054 domain-containing protein [Methyloglobulus sp.]
MFTISDFRGNFQEFSSISDATVNRASTLAGFIVSPNSSALVSNAKADLMTEYLVAHIIQLGLNTGTSASPDNQPAYPVASATEGSVSVSLLPPPAGNDALRFWLFTTQYGIALLSLARSSIAGGAYIGGEPNNTGVRER